MALQRGKLKDLPPDAVILSKIEAIEHQFNVIYDWHDWKDVFFFKYGSGLLGGASAAIGIYLNEYYRNKLKLRSYGSASSFLAIAVIPCGITMILHHQLILPRVILQETCAVCTEMRAAALQSILGSIVPSILAPAAGFSTALNYGTYNVPYLTQPREVLKLWIKLTRPIGNILFGLFLAQALLASGITILESRSVDNVNQKIELLYMKEQNA